MVKRGIGAVVLAIIAALLLGFLLKDKSRERENVVMDIPGTTTTENKIPSLSAAGDDAASTLTNGANTLTDNVKNAGTTVVAAAAGAGDAVTETVNDTTDAVAASVKNATTNTTANNNSVTAPNTVSSKPGFSIRPAGKNEQRGVIDGNNTHSRASTNTASNTIKRATNNNPAGNTRKSGNNVVASASSTPKETYRPRLIKERKSRVISSAQGASKPHKAAAKPKSHVIKSLPNETPKSTKPVVAANKSTKSSSGGHYAIQLMATSSQSRANKLANTMKREGYVSFVTETHRNNKVLYRVRIGVNGNRKAAIAAQQKMKRRYQKNFFVQNSLVVSR